MLIFDLLLVVMQEELQLALFKTPFGENLFLDRVYTFELLLHYFESMICECFLRAASLIFKLTNTSTIALAFQVFHLFDEKQNGVIEFDEFIHALSVFHPYAPLEEKIDCKGSVCNRLVMFYKCIPWFYFEIASFHFTCSCI